HSCNTDPMKTTVTYLGGRVLACLFAATALFCTSQAYGQITIVDTTGLFADQTQSVGNGTSSAQQFTTDSSSYSSLSAVTLKMDDKGLVDLPGSGFTVQLFNDNAGHPGSSLGTLSGNSNPATAGLYSYTPGGSIPLSANTPYWVVVSAQGGFEWQA